MATKKQENDAGQAEAQQLADQAAEQGFIGTKVDPVPNEEYSLESGPDAPPIHEARRDVTVAELED